MTELAVTGYASLDYAFGLNGQIAGDRTTLIDRRDPNAWPRLGGCPAYIAVAASKSGHLARPVSWIGDDPSSEIYLRGLAAAGVRADGVARIAGGISPVAMLAYQADGTCACLFDPGFAGDEVLTPTQREILSSATHLCVTAGPSQLMDEILAIRHRSTRLYWILKNDPNCFSETTRAELSKNADVIICSRPERSLIRETGNSVVVVETRGSDEIVVFKCGRAMLLDVEPIEVMDTTGAGDTFAGGYIAAEMAGAKDPLDAARAGRDCAYRLLKERKEMEAL